MDIKTLESEILQIEEILYVLDGDMERLQIDMIYTENLHKALLENVVVLKTIGIAVALDAYKKTKNDIKNMEARVKHNRTLGFEIEKKIASLEKTLLYKENLKNELLTQLSSDKVLIFKRNL